MRQRFISLILGLFLNLIFTLPAAAAVTNNSLGVAGTGRNTRLYSVKVLDDNGSGYYSWIINGLYWAADNGAEVINLSLGGTSGSTALQQAVDYAWNKGAILTAAAGNNGSNSRLYPAYYSHTIAVAATGQNDLKASWSNYGSWVDVAAPGVNIISTTPDNNYTYLSGTSMAAAHAAGVAALIKAAFPALSNQQVRNRLEQTADKIAGTGSYWTFGRINAAAAVTSVSPPPSASSVPSPSPSQSPSISPSPSSTSWWCRSRPNHRLCQ
jgi:thermitase